MTSILIVEDEPALLSVYSMLFRSQKFTVYEAENGLMALEILAAKKPDIIILDILMPVMGGIEFLTKAGIKKNYPKTKVLVLSNLSDNETIENISELGADEYKLKSSLGPDELVKAVRKLLKR